MTIHSFLSTLFIGLASGFLFGYFFREVAAWIVHFLDTHTEPAHLRRYKLGQDDNSKSKHPSVKD